MVTKMYCPRCKNEIPDGLDFCTFCDLDFTDGKKPKNENSKKKDTSAEIGRTYVFDISDNPFAFEKSDSESDDKTLQVKATDMGFINIPDEELENTAEMLTLKNIHEAQPNIDDRICKIGHGKRFLALAVCFSVIPVFLFLTGIYAVLIPLVSCLGLWICFFACSTTTLAPSRAGVTVLRVSKIVQLCAFTFALVAYIAILGFLSVFGNDLGFSGNTLFVFWVLLLIALLIKVFTLAVDTAFLGGLSHTVEYGAPETTGSMLFAVLHFSGALVRLLAIILMLALSTEISVFLSDVFHSLKLGLDLLSFLPEDAAFSLGVFGILYYLAAVAADVLTGLLAVSYHDSMLAEQKLQRKLPA